MAIEFKIQYCSLCKPPRYYHAFLLCFINPYFSPHFLHFPHSLLFMPHHPLFCVLDTLGFTAKVPGPHAAKVVQIDHANKEIHSRFYHQL